MTIGVKVSVPDLTEAFRGLERDQAAALTAAMRGATTSLKSDLQQQIVDAGLGERLARTWKANTYPGSGISLDPAGYAYSKAPKIVQAYASGATIKPVNGKRWLAIPTNDCPRQRSGRALTPDEVEEKFGRRLVFIDPKDKGFSTPSIRRAGVAFLVMNGLVVRKASSRWRGASQRELAGKTRNPRPVQSVIMFTLVPSVRVKKRFDLQDAADHAAADFVERYEQAVR